MISTEIVTAKPEIITPEIQQKVDEWKNKAGNTIMVLHAIQHHYGYVPRNISMYLCHYQMFIFQELNRLQK